MHDPRKLRPADLCRMLNSSPLGTVISTRTLYQHREQAGFRIGTGKTVDLFRYVAWAFDQRHFSPPAVATPVSDYQLIKERARARAADTSRAGRDIGPLPPVADPARRARAEQDLEFALKTYFPETFLLDWSDDHRRIIKKAEIAINTGGLSAYAMPRGSGKTSICECVCILALVMGKRDFIALIGSSAEAAEELLTAIKVELETNELLAADFPEVCFPIQCLEGIANRCKGQLCQGERTYIRWTNKELILPTVRGSQASGAIVKVAGITGRIRGMKHKLTDGRSIRPSLVIIDDPQTDESANSESQSAQRVKILSGAILGLAGPGMKIAGFMPCTVICAGDMADQILDRKAYPQWQGERTKMVYAFPKNEALWEQYRELRAEALRVELPPTEATDFYIANRTAMDEGALVAWEARREPEEISALQHAMNLRFDRGEDVFDAEFQNTPRLKREEDEAGSPDQIVQRLTRLKRGILPAETEHLVMFVDVQKKALWYVVAAFWKGFCGSIVDYGTFPEQAPRKEYTLQDLRKTLQKAFPGTHLEGWIYAGLEGLTDLKLGQEWETSNGRFMSIQKCVIDANWGDSSDVVYQFCRQSRHKAILLPSHGRGITAAMIPMLRYKRKPGERMGDHWVLGTTIKNKRGIQHLTYDTNRWKSFMAARISVAMGDKGGMTIFGQKPEEHALLARHMRSEYRVRTEGQGRIVDEWKLPPNRPDNHWWDCVVGCAVAASVEGCTLLESGEPPNTPKKRWADLRREKMMRRS